MAEVSLVKSHQKMCCEFTGWLSPKNIGIAAFMANVVLRIPFFSQWMATKRVRQLVCYSAGSTDSMLSMIYTHICVLVGIKS